MPRIDINRKAEMLELETEAIHTSLLKHQNLKKLSAQGSDGAETEFTDPQKLKEMRDSNMAHLATIYNHQDSK